MQKVRLLLTVCVFLSVVSAGGSFAYDRVVLIEDFTNINCSPCFEVASRLYNFIDNNMEDVAVVITHTYWEEDDDPWFLHAMDASITRMEYYDVPGIPYLLMDGQHIAYAPGIMQNTLQSLMEQESPVEIELLPIVMDGDSVHVLVTVNSGDEEVVGNYYCLRVALVEYYSPYEAPNGQDDWYYGLHAYQPDADGTAFSIEANSTEDFQFTFEWSDRYDAENLRVTAYIQNDYNREVIQAAMSTPVPYYAFTAETTEYRSICDPNSMVEFEINLENLGYMADTYAVELNSGMPDSWSITYSTPDGEQSGNSSISLDAGEVYPVHVSIETDEERGASGLLTLTFISSADPEETCEVSYYVLNTPHVLVINGDSDDSYEDYFSGSLGYASEAIRDEPLSYSVWPIWQYDLDAFDLGRLSAEAIIWFTGDHGSFTDAHLMGLRSYLINGGNLWISGSGAPQSIDGTNLLNMMGVESHDNYPSASVAYGVDDDPVGDNLSFNLCGGDGADNLGNPATLTANNGTPCLMYYANCCAGMRNGGQLGYRTLLLGFPFEAIADSNSRNELMLQALSWLVENESNICPAQQENVLPGAFSLYQNHPNPFNPTTEIVFTLPDRAEVSVTVFDVMGRVVVHLANGTCTAGSHQLTFDGSHLASGVYFCRMTVTGEQSFEATRKMMLMK